MRRRVVLAVLAAALVSGGAVLGVGCGYEGTGTASPETVEGSLPTPTETGPKLPSFPKGDASAGKSVFASAGCANCHTLQAAGATGTIGPNLDTAQPEESLILQRVYLGKGAMPSFKGQLSPQQMADVAAYVYSSTHGGQAPPASETTPTETTPTETTPTETTPTETTPTETTPTETTPTETTPTETTPTETTPTETTPTETTPTATTGGAGNATAGKAVFATAGCGSCHTLEAAGSSGTIGPNLDEAQPDLALIVDRVTNGKGPMPPFKSTLSAQQIQDVAAFVFQSTHSG
jgi:mono/diheme cytochrome c family protein